MEKRNFAAFILTHGRADRQVTYRSLRRCGYTGAIYLIVDDMDKEKDMYVEKYGAEVIVFDKKEAGTYTDQGDNTTDLRSVVYARNACFRIAQRLGITHFVELDDDYSAFEMRFDENMNYHAYYAYNLDAIFAAFVKFLDVSGASTVTMMQGGDFVGGAENQLSKAIMLKRKVMQTFFCRTDRPFSFMSKLNDDVTTYVRLGYLGHLMLCTNQCTVKQGKTQQNKGGLTEIYLEMGTYVKSFMSVMFQPSSVRVRYLVSMRRIHHQINWNSTTPKILSETLRKSIKA